MKHSESNKSKKIYSPIRVIAAFLALLCFFVVLNGGMYLLITRRLSNNFGNTNQAKMIDVRTCLPFEDNSLLARIETDFAMPADALPVLDGASALLPVYAAVINAIYPPGCVTYDGGSFSDDNYTGENFAEDSKMQYKNTLRGYRAIVDGETDVFFCSAPSPEQAQYAEDAGVELTCVPIGLEAFVFFVNTQNPVNDLTITQIRDIYAGKITNWKEVGGTHRFINPVTRLAGSGSQTAMEAFMGDTDFGKKSPFAFLGGAIGYSFRTYLTDIVGNSDVKMLSLNGIYPSKENIQNRSYPVIAEFYAIYRTDNENPNIPLLIEWLLSDEGQTLIEESGYVCIR